jgi:hypothetical protein
MKNTASASAILAGERRSARFRCRHSVAAGAQELGIPVTWVWFWLFAKRLKSQMWLRKLWVRLEDVRELVADDPLALRDAFYATGEFLTSREAIQQVVERWPDEPHPYVKFQLPAKRAPQFIWAAVASLPVSNPVLREEETA